MCYFGFSIPISSSICINHLLLLSHYGFKNREASPFFSFLSRPLFFSYCTPSATHGHQAIYSLFSFSFHHVYSLLDSSIKFSKAFFPVLKSPIIHGFSSFFFNFLDFDFLTPCSMASVLRLRKLYFVNPVKSSSMGLQSIEAHKSEDKRNVIVAYVKKLMQKKQDKDDKQKRNKNTNRGQSREWKCLDNCCWIIGYICTFWWLMFFLYHYLPLSVPGFPAIDSPGAVLKREGISGRHPVVLVPGIVTGGLELWDGKPCAEGLFRKRLWGGSFTETLKRLGSSRPLLHFWSFELILAVPIWKLELNFPDHYAGWSIFLWTMKQDLTHQAFESGQSKALWPLIILPKATSFGLFSLKIWLKLVMTERTYTWLHMIGGSRSKIQRYVTRNILFFYLQSNI